MREVAGGGGWGVGGSDVTPWICLSDCSTPIYCYGQHNAARLRPKTKFQFFERFAVVVSLKQGQMGFQFCAT